MKRFVLKSITGLAIILLVFGCSKEEDAYQTSVVRNVSFYMNDVPWSLNVGIATRTTFIYNANNGEYVANYSPHFKYALPNGSYRFFATDTPAELVPNPVNLNDFIIPQDSKSNRPIRISAAVEYKSPFTDTLKLNMISRTGTLRLRSVDKVQDASYSIVKAIVTTNRTGYKPIDESFLEGTQTLARAKETLTGGVNYADDFILLNTRDLDNGVSVRLEMMTKDSTVVRTLELPVKYEVVGNTVTLVEFNLNPVEEPVSL
jgi:hypothetical protein